MELLGERFADKKSLSEKLNAMNSIITNNRNCVNNLECDTLTLSSYVHKYLPIKMQRMLS